MGLQEAGNSSATLFRVSLCKLDTCSLITIPLRKGELWKTSRSNAAKQVVPRRVGNFVEPLSVFADELLSHLEKVKDESGTVQNIGQELSKWAFQGLI